MRRRHGPLAAPNAGANRATAAAARRARRSAIRSATPSFRRPRTTSDAAARDGPLPHRTAAADRRESPRALRRTAPALPHDRTGDPRSRSSRRVPPERRRVQSVHRRRLARPTPTAPPIPSRRSHRRWRARSRSSRDASTVGRSRPGSTSNGTLRIAAKVTTTRWHGHRVGAARDRRARPRALVRRRGRARRGSGSALSSRGKRRRRAAHPMLTPARDRGDASVVAPLSNGRRCLRAELQSLQLGTTFPLVDLPPRMIGTRWSIVRSFGANLPPQ